MKNLATFATAAAIVAAGISPVSAQDAPVTVTADPFVSTAGPALGLTPGLIAAGIAITVIGIAAIGSNDGT